MRLIIILILIVTPLFLVSQHEGSVEYTEIVKFQMDIPEGMEEAMSKMPKKRSTKQVLHFLEDISLYKNMDDADDEDYSYSSSEGGMHFEFKIAQPDHQVYRDLSTMTTKIKQDFMDKVFLIEDEMITYPWKIGQEKRKILDYTCMAATAQLDPETHVKVWFTPEIPLSLGPASYHGLPGLILVVEINEDERIIVAEKYVEGPVDEKDLEAPKRGKKVTRNEFEQIREAKLEEMNARRGGSNIHIITRSR